MAAKKIKILIEVTVTKSEGRACEVEEIAQSIMEDLLDNETVEPHGANNDDPSLYEVVETRHVVDDAVPA